MSTSGDIWNSGKGQLPPDKLKAYLEGKLSPEEQHEVESWLSEDGFEGDALEGLQSLPPEETDQSVRKLNLLLQNQLSDKRRKRRHHAQSNKWTLIAIGVVLLLAVLGYIVLHVLLR